MKTGKEYFAALIRLYSTTISHASLIKTFRLINIDHRVVREMLDNIWFMFDSDSSGKIDKKEFSAYDGLGDTITAQLASGR